MSPESGWGVATASEVFLNISVTYMNFAIKLVPSLPVLNFYFVFMNPRFTQY